MATILPELERELQQAAGRRLLPADAPHVAKPPRALGAVAVVAAVLVALVVAGGAIGLLTHDRSGQAHQTAVGPLPRSAWHTRLRSIPATIRIPGQTARAILGYTPGFGGLTLSVQEPNGESVTNGPISRHRFITHGITTYLGVGQTPGVALVPDGVARVAISASTLFPGRAPSALTSMKLRTNLRSTAGSAPVHDNVALIPVSDTPTIDIPSAISSTSSLQARATETWYSAQGAIVRRLRVDTQIVVRIHGNRRPGHYPTNSLGETYGSAAGAKPDQQPDLILVSGRAPNGASVTGYVKRAQLDAASCTPRTPKEAVRCDRLAGRSHTIPVYARNGTTVLGTFQVGGA